MRHPILKNLTEAVECMLLKLPKTKYTRLRKLVKQAKSEIQVIEDDAEIKARYLKYAQDESQRDGEIEFDDDAEVSLSDDGGAYVQGWYWVGAGDADMCSEQGCHKSLNDGEGYDGKCGECADEAEPEEKSDEVTDGSDCETDSCINKAAKIIQISLNAPGDGTRKVCITCSEAYSTGVQHGSLVQNPNYAAEPPKPAEHVQSAQPTTPAKAKVGRTKKLPK